MGAGQEKPIRLPILHDKPVSSDAKGDKTLFAYLEYDYQLTTAKYKSRTFKNTKLGPNYVQIQRMGGGKRNNTWVLCFRCFKGVISILDL